MVPSAALQAQPPGVPHGAPLPRPNLPSTPTHPHPSLPIPRAAPSRMTLPLLPPWVGEENWSAFFL